MGVHMSTDLQSIKYPFEEKEYILRHMHKFGRTREKAQQAWSQRLRGGWDRDNLGEDGALRLWLPKKEQIVEHEETFQEGAATEGSKTFTNPSGSDLDGLRMHAHECGLSRGHEFFSRTSTMGMQELANKASKEQPDGGGSGSAAGSKHKWKASPAGEEADVEQEGGGRLGRRPHPEKNRSVAPT